MKTITDFKNRMKAAQFVTSERYFLKGLNYELDSKEFNREPKIIQSNSFALSTVRKDGRIENSWCSWPKANEFKVLDENTVQITDGNFQCKLIYRFQSGKL